MADPAIQLTLTVDAPASPCEASVLGGGVRVVGADMSLVISLGIFDADDNLVVNAVPATKVCLPVTRSITWAQFCGGLSPLKPGNYTVAGLAFQADSPTPVAAQRRLVALTVPPPA